MKLIHRNGTDNFYLRKEVKGSWITITVTNMKCLWRSEMTEDDILNQFKKSNPLVQAKRERIIVYAYSCLDANEGATSLEVDDDSKALSLNLVNYVSEFKVKLNLTLHVKNSLEFFKEITNPLVAVVIQLMEQRSKLLALVKSKDRELREYKLEGAEISRKNVETYELLEKEFLEESLSEFMEKTDKNQLCTELNLSPDLLQIFNEVNRLKGEVPTSSDGSPAELPVATSNNDSTSSPVKKEIKRPLGNNTIVQVPRSKQRKKNFIL